MKRKITSLLFGICILLSLALHVSAAEAPLVVDQADLLTAEQETALAEKAAALGETYQMDLVIVTNESLGGKSPEEYADDYFDDNGYGYGDNASGILFLLSMEYRDWYISTCGDGIYALTDYGIQQVGEAALPYLGDGEYYAGFDTFLDALEPYLEHYQNGTPIDGHADLSGDYYTGTREDTVYYEGSASFGSVAVRVLFQSLIVGALVAAAAVIIMRATMNTRKKQAAASAYLVPNSFRLHRHQDMFLYSRVNKTRRQESSSHGGGSSTHRSSSGRSHGGGGGKF